MEAIIRGIRCDRHPASKQQRDKIEKATGLESNHTHEAKRILVPSKNSNHDPLLWVVYSGFVLDSSGPVCLPWARQRWAYGHMGRFSALSAGGRKRKRVAFSRIFCAGDRGGQEAVCVCVRWMGWIRTGTGPARIMPLGLYSHSISRPLWPGGGGEPTASHSKREKRRE